MTFGQRLQRLRLKKGLSQRQLARRAQMRHATISELESGHRTDTRARHLVTLARILGTTAEYLLTGRGPPSPGSELQG